MRIVRQLQARVGAVRLRRSDDPVLAAVGEALAYPLAPDEREWVDRIEAERRRLAGSDEILRTALYDYTLDPEHDHVFEDRVEDLATRSSKPPDAARFLFALLRRLRPDRVLELGTALGISAAYQGAALRLNGIGSLVTVDASKERMRLAREVFERLALDEVVDARLGRFQQVLPEVLAEPYGIGFVDGHHEEQATLDDLELILPALEFPGVIVFDDITWSQGMERVWAKVKGDQRVSASAEVLGMGVCVYHLPPGRGSSVGRAHD